MGGSPPRGVIWTRPIRKGDLRGVPGAAWTSLTRSLFLPYPTGPAFPSLLVMLVLSALWPLGRKTPATSDLIRHRYDRPITPMARGVVAAKVWRIEPGGYASIEK